MPLRLHRAPSTMWKSKSPPTSSLGGCGYIIGSGLIFSYTPSHPRTLSHTSSYVTPSHPRTLAYTSSSEMNHHLLLLPVEVSHPLIHILCCYQSPPPPPSTHPPIHHDSFVALGNCGKKRYLDGISKMNESSAYESLKPGSKGKKALEDGKLQKSMDSKATAFDMTKFKLPEIKFARKASRSVRKLTADDANDANIDKLTLRLGMSLFPYHFSFLFFSLSSPLLSSFFSPPFFSPSPNPFYFTTHPFP